MEYDHFMKSQRASRNSLQGLTWCKFGHVTVEISTHRDPRSPPNGTWVLIRFQEQLLGRTVKWFRGGLVFKAHQLLYHSTPGSRAIKKKKKVAG